MFRSLTHFEFIFVYGVRKCSSFVLLQVADQFSQHHLLKRLSFLHCIFLPPLSKIRFPSVQFSSVQSLSHVWLFLTPRTAACQASLSITNSWRFSNESILCIRWSKYWNFSFSISPSNEYSGHISLRTDWFDLFALQRTLENLLQNHSSKASILKHSAFFIVQLSHT